MAKYKHMNAEIGSFLDTFGQGGDIDGKVTCESRVCQ